MVTVIQRQRISFVRGVVLALVMACGVAAAPAPAQAQMIFAGGGPGGSGGGLFEPPVSTREADRFASILGLAEDQKEALHTLLEAMQTEFDSTAREARDQMDAVREDFQENRDPSVFGQKMPEIMGKLRGQRDKLEKGFMDDVKSLLTAPQVEQWPVLERAHRRERTLGRGTLSGESVDVVRLTEGLSLPPDVAGSLRPILDQYESELDRALIERNDLIEKQSRRMLSGPGGIELAAQSDEFRKLMEGLREASTKVRDINRKYERQIAGMLPPDLAARMNAEFKKQSFPSVYRDSHAARSLSAAEAFADLTPEQRQALSAIREAYAREAAQAGEKWAAAIEEQEAKGGDSTMNFGGGRVMRMRTGDAGDQPDPAGEARAARQKLDERLLENLNGVLTDAQRERLPKKRAPRGDGPLGRRPQGPGAPADAGQDAGGVVGVHVMQLRTAGPDGEPTDVVKVIAVHAADDAPSGDGDGPEEEVEVVVVPGGPAAAPPSPAPAAPPASPAGPRPHPK